MLRKLKQVQFKQTALKKWRFFCLLKKEILQLIK